MKKLVLLAAAGALVVAFAGSAVAARGHAKHATTTAKTSHGPGGVNDDLAAAATYLGVTDAVLLADLQSGKTLAEVASATSGKTTAGLIAALVTAETTEINARVSAGTETQAQADTQIADLTTRFSAFVDGTHLDDRGPGHGGPGGPRGPSDDLAAAATYLGVTNAALVADLQSGKTLAQVASSTSGKTTAGLIAALVTHETAEINARVTAGAETRAEADTHIAGLAARFTALVNGTLPPFGGHRH